MAVYGPVIINLSKRHDRLNKITAQFDTYNLDYKICEAILNETDGHTGCLASHIKALEMKPEEAEAIWICEDDCLLEVNPDELQLLIKEFMSSDAVGLCLGFKDLYSVPYNSRFRRTFGVISGGCYLLKRSIYKSYLHLAKVSYESRVTGKANPYEFYYYSLGLPERCVSMNFADRFWQIIMQDNIWLIPMKHVARQYDSYSDIQKLRADPGY